MFDKIKDGDLITLKLASGEEVIAKFVGKEPTHIIIAVSYTHLTLPTT